MSTDRCANPFEILKLFSRGSDAGGRILFVCYLDDSDTELEPNICIAGYYSTLENWLIFERAVAPVFAKYNVKVMSGKDLRGTRGDFNGWSHQERLDFVGEVFAVGGAFITQGVSSCVDKNFFKRLKDAGHKGVAGVSPLGCAFSVLMNAIELHSPVAAQIEREGISFIVESGHANSANLEKYFHLHRKAGGGGLGANSTITFVAKDSCKAIQMADMLAFYSRRAMNKSDPKSIPRDFDDSSPVFSIIRRSISHRFNHIWREAMMPDLNTLSPDDADKIALGFLPGKGFGR